MDATYLGAIVSGVGLLSGAVGTVVGSKVAVTLLQRAHERFEDAVWKAIDADREKNQKLAERMSALEATCRERSREGGCV